MRILQVNNFHYLRGGSERAYFDTSQLLAEQGHEVAHFSVFNPENVPSEYENYFPQGKDLNKAYGLKERYKVAKELIYNREAKENFRKILADFQPDLVHFHNIYHHLTPVIINEAKKRNIATVMTLHDYKLVSPNYNLFVGDKIWEPARGEFWRTIKDKAIKNSRAKSVVGAIEDLVHRRILKSYEKINVFISPSQYLLNKFVNRKFKGNITHIPNIFKKNIEMDEASPVLANYPYFVYFGRLSEEKGVRDLIAAYIAVRPKYRLLIVGDGPLRNSLEAFVNGSNLYRHIKFAGHKTGSELWSVVKGAEFVALTSRWYENAPYSVVESMSLGKVVVAPRIGGIAEMINHGRTGYLFDPHSQESLEEAIRHACSISEKDRAWVGLQAKEETRKKYNEEKHYNSLMYIYNEAIKSAN